MIRTYCRQIKVNKKLLKRANNKTGLIKQHKIYKKTNYANRQLRNRNR